jgi:hypothetical protein
MYKPVVWSRKSQMTGDTILLYMDSSGIRKMYIPSNAAIISLAGPEKAGLYDQVQGKTITGYFEGNAITEMLVWPAAETIYYPKDDSGAFMGVNQSESERMRIFFKDQQIKRILFEQQVKQTITPMEKADFPSLKLSRFIWLEDKRPKSLKEIFE